MTKNTLRAYLGLLLLTFVLGACDGKSDRIGGSAPLPPPQGSEDETAVTPDPANPDSVMNTLVLRVGGREAIFREDSDLPPASNVSDQPTVASQRASTTTTNGSTVQIPVEFQSTSGIARLFAKVQGASSRFDIDFTEEVSTNAAPRSLKSTNGVLIIAIVIPPDILGGEFVLEVAAEDEQGLVSQKAETTVAVERVGTGTLQFSLSWNEFVDLDLEVTDPNGETIAFFNPQSSSGGQLDRDDIEGGPGSVENIFWEGSAPTGTYQVDVNYFSGFDPSDYTVTISIDGRVFDSLSRTGFQESDGLEPVYTLQYGGSFASSSGQNLLSGASAQPGPEQAPQPEPSELAEQDAIVSRLQGTWSNCEPVRRILTVLVFEGNTYRLDVFRGPVQPQPGQGPCDGETSLFTSSSGTFAVGPELLALGKGPGVMPDDRFLANEFDFVTERSSILYDIVWLDDNDEQIVFSADQSTFREFRPEVLDFGSASFQRTQ